MIRHATLADAPQVRAIWNTMITDSTANFSEIEKTLAEVEEILRERPRQGYPIFVAEDERGVVGFATYFQFRANSGYRFTMENTVALLSEAKGCGYGRALMQAVEDHARSGGVHSMIAGVSAKNPEGLAFHAALGYATVATVPQSGHKWGEWLDLVLMQKFL
ncbi:GNAT family N-acetyltransferase [Falsirhodobacter halotolerans]|uniref:GNAT family N-acetyltransferase n=1 Tax=Falsirhodobacter halotolerans TaxID=1146892 RepID=UPI001FD33CC7|nr:GNAT family N-acetyltransferase [Falsirhodobacter halotolerans]MCJ8138869.1 N-acetyltransferase family protein [Falsirhodobacter halotolerans]